jgi:hypothetical protein
MPHSPHYATTPVISHVTRLDPKTILDVGVGYGKWGFLLREALDWVLDRHERAQWQTTIDGLEVFEGYKTPLYDWVYNRVDYGDIREIAETLPPYDLVLIAEVIEHLTKDEGLHVLRTVLSRSRNAIVTTPVDFFTQDICGNPAEQHHSLWSLKDFIEWPVQYEVHGHNTIVAVLAGNGATWPTARETRVSKLAYKATDRGSLGPQLVRAVARRLPI